MWFGVYHNAPGFTRSASSHLYWERAGGRELADKTKWCAYFSCVGWPSDIPVGKFSQDHIVCLFHLHYFRNFKNWDRIILNGYYFPRKKQTISWEIDFPWRGLSLNLAPWGVYFHGQLLSCSTVLWRVREPRRLHDVMDVNISFNKIPEQILT